MSNQVESLGLCIWWEDILAERLVTYDTGSTSTVDWEPYWKKTCIPAQTPTSGGCSWFSYHATPSWRTQTTWPLASTCLYPGKSRKPSEVAVTWMHVRESSLSFETVSLLTDLQMRSRPVSIPTPEVVLVFKRQRRWAYLLPQDLGQLPQSRW